MMAARNLLIGNNEQFPERIALHMKGFRAFMRFLTSESNDKDGGVKRGRLYALADRMSDQFQHFYVKRGRILERKQTRHRKTGVSRNTDLSAVTNPCDDQMHPSTAFPGQVPSVHSSWMKNPFTASPSTLFDPYSVSDSPQQLSLPPWPPWTALTPLDFLPTGNDSYFPALREPVNSARDPMYWPTSHESRIGLGNGVANPPAPERMTPILQDVRNSSPKGQCRQMLYSNQDPAGFSSSPSFRDPLPEPSALNRSWIQEAQSQGPTFAATMKVGPPASLPGERHPISDNDMSRYFSQLETSLATPRSVCTSSGPSAVVNFNPSGSSESQMFNQDRF